MMHTIHLPCHIFDFFFAEVKRQFRDFLAEALTLGNLHTRIFMIFLFYDAAAGYLGVVRKETPSPSTLA